MFSNHTEVLVPLFVVPDGFLVQLLESKCTDVACQLMRVSNLHWQLFSVLLIFDYSNDHAFEDQICLASVRMRLGQFSISQCIVTVVKLSDVSPKVLHDGELTARMDVLVSIGA